MANQVIIDETRNQISVIEGQTRIIEVAAQGPQGPVGPRGEAGPSGSSILNQITSGSVTASVDIGSAAFTVVSASSNLFNVGSNGNVGIGVASPTYKLDVLGALKIQGAFYATSNGPKTFLIDRYSNNPFADEFGFRKARGTMETASAVISEDQLGGIEYYGYDGSGFIQSAMIYSNVDGTVSAGSVPGRLSFYVNNGGSTNVNIEAIRINSSGNVGIGTVSPNAKLHVSGSTILAGNTTITGSLLVTGNITAQTLVVQTITSSVLYSSGSNIFGNSLTNTQQFTGSVSVTGSSVSFNGSGGFNWDGINNRLGIGTGSVSGYVHINQPISNVNDTIDGLRITTNAYNSTGRHIYLENKAGTYYYSIGGLDGGALYMNSNIGQQWQYSGTTVATLGSYYDGTEFSSVGIIGRTNGVIPLIIVGKSGQTADLLRIKQHTAGNYLLQMKSNGNLILQNGGTFTDTGERLQVSGSVSFNSSSGFNWDGVNNRLGIGTNAPSYNLDVTGTVRIGSSTNGYIFNSNTISTFGNIFLSIQGDRFFSITDNSYNSVYFRVIRNTGNVLINSTTDTGERLQVSGSVKITDSLVVTGSITSLNSIYSNGILFTPAGIFCDSNTARFRHVTVGVNQGAGTGFIQPEDGSQSIGIRTGASFGGTTRLLVTSTGNVLINNTVDDTVNRLQVTGSSRFSGNMTITGSTTVTGNVLISSGTAGTFIGSGGSIRYTSESGVNTNAVYLSGNTTGQDVLIGFVGGGATTNIYSYIQTSGYIGTRGSLKLGASSGTDVITALTSSWLRIAAGTTTRSQINLAPSTAPTSPNDGDIWYDGTNLYFRSGSVTKTFVLA